MRFPGISVPLVLSLILFLAYPILASANNQMIRIATTTSTANSGLTARLIPAFEKSSGYRIELAVSGTGRALRQAREGKADLLIVHAPTAEQKFMQEGHGQKRQYLMKNQFIIVGPADDPAGISRIKSASQAFKVIAAKQTTFISRADDSGTHKKELGIWSAANIQPYGGWYFELGMGMGDSLQHANKLAAYILTDSATWLAKRKQLSLKELLRGDPELDNPYHLITVNHKKHPSVNVKGAQIFTQWIFSSQGQDIIRTFSVDQERLFTPAK